MTSINEMFQETNTTASNNPRSLAGTNQLTAVAATLASELLKELDGRVAELGELGKQSKSDHKAMDQLIEQALHLSDRDVPEVDFLKELPANVLDGMLKSQQSKRSRAKGKAMTLDNYMSMVIGAISETLLRKAMDKPKSGHVGTRRATVVSYTDEELEKYRADPEAVKRELRNLQSKKSIMRSKADFDEADERYLSLLAAEDTLKEIRNGAAADKTKVELAAVFNEIDISQLKGADAKELLARIAGLIK